MNTFHEQQFLNLCGSGKVDAAKRKLEKDGVNVNYKSKQNGNTAAHAAALNDQLQTLRFLAQNEFNFSPASPEDLMNNQGNTPLHIASDKPNFEVMLFLLMQGHPTLLKNKKGMKPGDSTMEARIFMSSIVPQEKAFNALKPQHKTKLTEIFKDIDFDDVKAIDMHKAVRFNKFIEQTIPEATAEKDAKDFIKCTAICNKSTVNIDEWLFSFSKLYVCDEAAFEKFIADYDRIVAAHGKLKEIHI